MKITSTRILTIFAGIGISACSTNAKYSETTLIKDIDEHISTPFEHKSVSNKDCYEKEGQRNIAIFFDGTANNPSSETNLFKLKNMATMQPMAGECPQNYVLYVKGIGSQGNWFKKLLEGMTGWGIGEDVRQAYQYVSTYYRGEQDNIYIFGFSRGAAAARILASFLDTAGTSKKILSEESIEHLYAIYKGNESIDSRKKSALDFIGSENKIIPEVAFMGLFDTVAALGFTHFGEDKAELNSHYSDTLCSVKRAAHAVSIDDNRSSDFTPALISKKQIRYCEELKPNLSFVDQVWFSGAHSDIGGGYLDTDLSGVTLNWMIGRVISADEELGKELGNGHVPLIKNATTTYEDPLGLSHDAEEDSWYSRNQNRDWPNILNKTNKCSENKKYLETGFEAPKIHKSVEFRLAHKPRKEGSRDFDWMAESDEFTSNYSNCFTQQETNEGILLTLKECPVLQPGEACPTVWGAKPADCPG
jgi:hypothetical protein